MINSQNKHNNPIKIRRNKDTLEKYNVLLDSWVKLKLIGFNDTGASEYSYSFNSPLNVLTNTDNHFLNEIMDKSTGRNIGSNNDFKPLLMNSKRQYLSTSSATVINSTANQESIVASSTETYEDNVLYFLPIKDLNINVTSIPLINITYNNSLTNEQKGTYFPVIEDLGSGKIGNTGRVTAIIAHNIASYNVTANPTVTISGGGLATPVNIPASKFRIRKRSIRSINIENKGFGYKATGNNKGFAHYVAQVEKYYYSMFDGFGRDNTSTINPTILSRIRTYTNIIPQSGTVGIDGSFDYYSNSNQTWLTKERNEIFDAWIFDGGEYMPSFEYIDKGVRSTRFDCTNDYDQFVNSTSYQYDFDGFNGYEFSGSLARYNVRTYTESDIRSSWEHAKKYGIYTLYNFWYAFKAWSQGGYGTSQAERKAIARRSRVEFKTNVMSQLRKIASVTEDDEVMIILGNESNLDYMLQDFDYSTGSPTFGQNIYWADPLNPTNLQLNVEAMVTFFNDFAGEIKASYGSKFKIIAGMQYADGGRMTQMEICFNKNLFSNFDAFGNNYYGNKTTAQPWINNATTGIDMPARYAANVSTSVRLPMIILEAGSPSVIYGNSTGANATNYETQQGDIMKNMLKTIDANDFMNGVLLFGFWNQPNRGNEFLLANYDGFNFPAIAPVVQTHFNEKDMGVVNFPQFNPAGYEDNYTNTPSASEFLAAAKPALATLRSDIATNHTNSTKFI